MTDRVDINRLLLEMRSLKSQTQAFNPQGIAARDVAAGANGVQSAEKVNGPQFSELMSQAIGKVNEVQQSSSAMSAAYVQGDPNIDVTDVMIASQKASVAFESMVQVRNKLVEAYRDVMNMPI